ncbi:uncharacterized protein LOC130294360 [Hyla sarda]|uniref:uncharacterized protein LOC130294360 n=1 Tax=Hyla sarda TaxID=327740 RepID=UPI0024C41011|nr:uncharacterized protein LOC130294360 [Hyla sarda]
MAGESSQSGLGQDMLSEAPLSAAQIQELINRSVKAALATVAAPSVSHMPVTADSAKKGKALYKRKHTVAYDSPAGEETYMQQTEPTMACHPAMTNDPIRPPGLRECTKRHKSIRRSKPNSFDTSEEDSAEEESGEPEGTDSGSENEAGLQADFPSTDPGVPVETILDTLGQPFFHPEAIIHPRSGDWAPLPQVAAYIEYWTRRTLDRVNRNKLRAECPRPFLSKKVAITPEIDPVLMKYLSKSGKYSKKGIERSLKAIQDRILDLLGPLTKILNLSEQAASSGDPVDITQLRGWAQRAMCMLGTANTTCSIERRRSILMKLEPQLSHLAENEPGPSAEGLLFGEDLLKNINKFVGLFTGLDKAQNSLKKSSGKVFNKAGRGRGRSAGRGNYYRPYARPPAQPYVPPPQQYTMPMAQPAPFFPPRGRPWRGRGGRGYPRSRPSSGY